MLSALHRYIKSDLASSQLKAIQHTHRESGSLNAGPIQCMQYTWCAAQVHDVKMAVQDCTLTQMNVKAERDVERHRHLPLALLSSILINFVRHMVCELC